MELLGNRARDPEAAGRVRTWAQEIFGLGAAGGVMVSELRCGEEGCPPLETVVVLSPAGGATVQHKLHKPIRDVTRADLEALQETTR